MTGFNLLAIIEAGHIKADDDTLAIMQNIEPGHARTICKWLALATNQPAHLRLMGIGQIEEIHYTPDQVRATMQRADKTIEPKP